MFSGILVRPISSATTTNPTTTANDVRPNSSLRVNDGSASHNAPITRPTFSAAPRHMSWLPSRPKHESMIAMANSPNAMSPTNERFTATVCGFWEFMLPIMWRAFSEGKRVAIHFDRTAVMTGQSLCRPCRVVRVVSVALATALSRAAISTQSVQASSTVESMALGEHRYHQPDNFTSETHPHGASSMLSDSSDSTHVAPDVLRAEQALQTLRLRVTKHADQQSRLKQFYRDWQQNWLDRAEHLHEQMNELEARISPWLPREVSPRLSVMSVLEEAA